MIVNARPTLLIGSQTQWGRISAVGLVGSERYYWMTDEDGGVAMMPADTVERSVRFLSGSAVTSGPQQSTPVHSPEGEIE